MSRGDTVLPGERKGAFVIINDMEAVEIRRVFGNQSNRIDVCTIVTGCVVCDKQTVFKLYDSDEIHVCSLNCLYKILEGKII